jgi:hypothetical protein
MRGNRSVLTHYAAVLAPALRVFVENGDRADVGHHSGDKMKAVGPADKQLVVAPICRY